MFRIAPFKSRTGGISGSGMGRLKKTGTATVFAGKAGAGRKAESRVAEVTSFELDSHQKAKSFRRFDQYQ